MYLNFEENLLLSNRFHFLLLLHCSVLLCCVSILSYVSKVMLHEIQKTKSIKMGNWANVCHYYCIFYLHEFF